MDALFVAGVVFLLVFASVIIFGAPYLPTLSKRIDDALYLLALQPGQTFLELGSGDGRLLIAAAEKGIHGIGYELNPLLVLYSRARTWKYRKLITIKWANYWTTEWERADAIYVFLLPKYMDKLNKKVVQYSNKKPLTVVSFAFMMPDKVPSNELKSMFQYKY